MKRGNLSELEKNMVEPEPENYKERLSPALQEMMDEIQEDIYGKKTQELDETGPDLRPVEVYEKAKEVEHRREPDLPRRSRVCYKCVAEHSFHGRRWSVGQVWDSSNPDGPEPPADGGEYWIVFNPADKPTGLQPTRRVR